MKSSKFISVFLSACMLLTACSAKLPEKNPTTVTETTANENTPIVELPKEEWVTREASEGATEIILSDDGVCIDGEPASDDPGSAVYTANDIVFYLEGQGFTYGEGEEKDAHSQAEADVHTVVHITEPGEYVLSGKLSAGQIAVDLGEDREDDPNAVVTLVLSGVDITCTVAPAVIFYNVYECGTVDEEKATMDVDTSAAGANVIIADGSENNIRGAYVAKIYKSVELNDAGTEVVDSKKLHKYDAAFYSRKTMNIYGEKDGSGVLNIFAENEGLDSELHLTIYSGNIHIESGNDGINTNEDNVSVTHILGGNLDIVVNGTTGEGDGIDSNGYLVIDGGKVTASACGFSGDAGIDADKGVYIRGGHVAASGNMYDHVAGEQTCAVFTFSQRQPGGNDYAIRDTAGEPVFACTPENDFQYLIVSAPDLPPGEYTLWQGSNQLMGASGQMGGGYGVPEGLRPERPEGMEKPEGMGKPDGDFREPPTGERPEGNPPEGIPPERMEPPEGGERPEGMNGLRPGGFGGDAPINPEEATEIFVIAEGGNFFRVLS